MTELEIAVSDWKQVCERVPIHSHPSVWASHYTGDQGLGSIHATRPADEGAIACILLSPFSCCEEVTDSFLVVDRPNHIWVARLSVAEKGTWMTFWRVPYSMRDDGTLSFGVSEKMPWPSQRLVNALQATMEHRDVARKWPFYEAYYAAVALGTEHENS